MTSETPALKGATGDEPARSHIPNCFHRPKYENDPNPNANQFPKTKRHLKASKPPASPNQKPLLKPPEQWQVREASGDVSKGPGRGLATAWLMQKPSVWVPGSGKHIYIHVHKSPKRETLNPVSCCNTDTDKTSSCGSRFSPLVP